MPYSATTRAFDSRSEMSPTRFQGTKSGGSERFAPQPAAIATATTVASAAFRRSTTVCRLAEVRDEVEVPGESGEIDRLRVCVEAVERPAVELDCGDRSCSRY